MYRCRAADNRLSRVHGARRAPAPLPTDPGRDRRTTLPAAVARSLLRDTWSSFARVVELSTTERGGSDERAEVEGMRVVAYIRVSTREQSEEGYSLPNQRAAIEEECARRGWELAEVIEDAGFSGRNDDRPGLNRAMAMLARRNGPQAIVVARLDRLCRSITHLGKIIDLSSRQKWGIVALDHDLNTASANGRLVAHIIGSVAQWESEMMGERVSKGMRAAHAAARADGKPFGFQRTTPDQVVSRIVRARKRGDSFHQIAQRLDRQKVATPGNGARWYPATIRRIYNSATKVTS